MGGFFNSLSSYFGSSSSDTHHSTYTGGRAATDSGPSGGPNSSGGGGFGRNRSSGAFGFNNNRDVLAATRDAFSLPSHHGPYHDTSLNGSRSGSPGASYTEGTGGLTPLGRANLSVSGGFSFLFFECLGTRWAGYGMCRVSGQKSGVKSTHPFSTFWRQAHMSYAHANHRNIKHAYLGFHNQPTELAIQLSEKLPDEHEPGVLLPTTGSRSDRQWV